MLRHLIKLSRCPALRHEGLINYKHAIPINTMLHHRLFSSEMIADWPDAIKTFLAKEKIEKPTLIQEKTLPIAMNNKDLVGVARTGSGKTLAFVIPAVMKILKEREAQGIVADGKHQEKLPTCLVLAPTRELANQTADIFKKFRHLGIRSLVLVGGASRSAQINDLSYRDHDVYIATPGRLLDLMDSDLVDLSGIKYLVLDEADRMLDMGFEPQIRKVVRQLSQQRQTLMWSATWPLEIQSLANEFMNNYEHITVDSEKLKANPNIKQLVEVCDGREKLSLTINYLDTFKTENEEPRTLIFVNTKRMAEQLLLQLMRNKHRAVSMHGDRSQRQRDDALRMFKNRLCNIMVATDVAARGLDIDDITHVINYDFPNTIEDYIHRIGRTARHEKKGTSISFLTSSNFAMVDKLTRVLRETGQNVPKGLQDLARERRSFRY